MFLSRKYTIDYVKRQAELVLSTVNRLSLKHICYLWQKAEAATPPSSGTTEQMFLENGLVGNITWLLCASDYYSGLSPREITGPCGPLHLRRAPFLRAEFRVFQGRTGGLPFKKEPFYTARLDELCIIQKGWISSS